MAEKEYIEREAVNAVLSAECSPMVAAYLINAVESIPAADMRPVVTCTDCKYNNHCLTQEFVEEASRIPFDRNTFFCADGERRSNANN